LASGCAISACTRRHVSAGLRHQHLHARRQARRHRGVALAHHEVQRHLQRRKPGQLTLKARQIPIGHHAQGACHMVGALHQACIESLALRVQRGARAFQQPLDAPRVLGAPGHEVGHSGRSSQQLGHGREELEHDAVQGQQRAVQADDRQHTGCHRVVERRQAIQCHANRDRSASGVANHQAGLHAHAAHQLTHRLRHGRHRGRTPTRQGREAVPRQIDHQHGPLGGDQRRQAAPRMRRRTRAVQEQRRRGC
jgi:hypothetical protein